MNPADKTPEWIEQADNMMAKFDFVPMRDFEYCANKKSHSYLYSRNGEVNSKLTNSIVVDISAIELTEANIVRYIILAAWECGENSIKRQINRQFDGIKTILKVM